jgi:hypothetical protein
VEESIEHDMTRIFDECFRNPATLEEAEALGIIRRYTEPDYSRSILRELEETYNLSTMDVLCQTIQAVALSQDVLSKWLYNYRIYVEAGGTLGMLARPDFEPNFEDRLGAGRDPAPSLCHH